MRRGRNNPENIPELRGQETRQLAATKAGFGNETTYRQAKSIVEQGAPELIEAVDRGQASISAAAEIATLPKNPLT